MLTAETLIRLGSPVFRWAHMPVCLFYREAAHIMLLNIYYPAASPDLFEAYLIAVDIAAKYAKENLN